MYLPLSIIILQITRYLLHLHPTPPPLKIIIIVAEGGGSPIDKNFKGSVFFNNILFIITRTYNF